ncbi:hypothetical protein BCR44DRAFT_1433803 [Catenaria anguillulae PL171]|uniref:Uncharacterized protein n=1 Tax=Catenaria anguillulae PL171 TaxID=765915 RepID=A0A1Y2HLW3_9FUNG|nr:hypothetical protein BCR44DRAFT_1433803 [Catenaria anguillulae PL171]
MRETVRTYTMALIVTGVTGVIGVIVFFLQFVANIPGFSLIACLYCLMMYIGYVARRTPFLIMWCKWEPPAWLNKCLGRKAEGPLLPVASASGTASMTSSPSSAFGASRTAR